MPKRRTQGLAPALLALSGMSGMVSATAPVAAVGGGAIIHVDDDAAPGGDGSTFSSAAVSLQDALETARNSGGDVIEVRVAQGIYRPDDGESEIAGDRAATFLLPPGIAVRGGYAGVGAADPDERDVVRFPSILSGDLAGDDGPGFTGRGENAYHVVTAASALEGTVIDGFLVTGGSADGAAPHDRGAGLLLDGAAVSVVDVTVAGNAAVYGGGVYEVDAEDSFDRVTVTGNRATFGGGLFIDGGGSTFSFCAVTANEAISGAGLYFDTTDPALHACVVAGNAASFDGGGLYGIGSSPMLTACVLNGNDAAFKGGGARLVGGAPIVDGCRIVDNTADEGGGIALRGAAALLSDCRFQGNGAEHGGGLLTESGDPLIVECDFRRNTAARGGGLARAGGAPVLLGTVFKANTAVDGAGVHAGAGGGSFTDCALMGNIASRQGAGMMIEGGGAVIERCAFTDNEVVGGLVNNGGGLYLAGAADVSIVDSTITSNVAKFGGGFAAATSQLTVITTVLADNVGQSGGAGYLVGGATIFEDCRIEGNTATQGTLARGGAVSCREGDLVFRRCRIAGNACDIDGGGVHHESGSLVLSASTFEGNTAGSFGGGASIDGVIATVDGCRFVTNVAARGAGMYALLGEIGLTSCLFVGNLAAGTSSEEGCTGEGRGGGFLGIVGAPVLVNCTFVANAAGCAGRGGGVNLTHGVVRNCILWENLDAGGNDESAQIDGGPVTVGHSCIQGLTGGLGGEGNIAANPVFRDPLGPDGAPGTADDDLRLAAGSPCIDAGDNTALPPGATTDVDGLPRRVDDPRTPDTGSGDPPLVDMGGHEFQPGASCPADVDGDGAVGFTDLTAILAAWGACGNCPEDVDGDGLVGFLDLVEVLTYWGPC